MFSSISKLCQDFRFSHVCNMGPEIICAVVNLRRPVDSSTSVCHTLNLMMPIVNTTSVSYYCYTDIFYRHLNFCNVFRVFLTFEIVPAVVLADCRSLGVNLRIPVDRARSVSY